MTTVYMCCSLYYIVIFNICFLFIDSYVEVENYFIIMMAISHRNDLKNNQFLQLWKTALRKKSEFFRLSCFNKYAFQDIISLFRLVIFYLNYLLSLITLELYHLSLQKLNLFNDKKMNKLHWQVSLRPSISVLHCNKVF